MDLHPGLANSLYFTIVVAECDIETFFCYFEFEFFSRQKFVIIIHEINSYLRSG